MLTSRDGEKDNGCVVSTLRYLKETPGIITVSVNKRNMTHDMIVKTGLFNVSVLAEGIPFGVFQLFGMKSGKNTDKFSDFKYFARSKNGIAYLNKHISDFMSAKVISSGDRGTHTLFTAEITESLKLSEDRPVTYDYYYNHIKPKPAMSEGKKGYACRLCGYLYEGENIPGGFVCPVCKHGVKDFEALK